MDATEFKQKRIFLGYTQQSLANKLGLAVRTIRYYESGQVPINKTVKLLLTTFKSEEQRDDNRAM